MVLASASRDVPRQGWEVNINFYNLLDHCDSSFPTTRFTMIAGRIVWVKAVKLSVVAEIPR